MKTTWCRPPALATSTEIVMGPVADGFKTPLAGSALLVVDGGFASHHPETVRAFRQAFAETAVYEVAGGESTKDMSAVGAMWGALSSHGLDRSGTLIALGGGAVLDAASFAAATWQRGIDVWLAPTTLTAQVDAALGGKSAVNLDHIKNQIGVIRQPNKLLIDTSWVTTLSATEYRSGLGEVAKTALLAGGRLFDLVTQAAPLLLNRHGPTLDEVITLCLSHKAQIVEADPLDHGVRNSLNAGHTLGHVLESLARTRGIALTHGEAVALGLGLESAYLPGYDRASVTSLLTLLGLSQSLPFAVEPTAALALLMKDKKRAGRAIRLPVIEAPGSVSFHAVLPEDLVHAFARPL